MIEATYLNPADTAYRVFLDGEHIGKVVPRRERSSTTYKGTRIRRDLGFPRRWYGSPIGFGATRASTRGHDTRVLAAQDLADRVLSYRHCDHTDRKGNWCNSCQAPVPKEIEVS